MRNTVALLALNAILFSGCIKKTTPKEVEYEYKKTIIIAKTERLVKCNTRYTFVYGDYEQCDVTLSLYLKYNVGDTLLWIRQKKDKTKKGLDAFFQATNWRIVSD